MAPELSLRRAILLIAAVIPAALLLAVLEPWWDADWKRPTWEMTRIGFNFYAFLIFGIAHAVLFGLPALAVAQRLDRWTLSVLALLGMVATGGPWLLFFLAGAHSGLTIDDIRRFGGILAIPFSAGAFGGAVFWLLIASLDARIA